MQSWVGEEEGGGRGVQGGVGGLGHMCPFGFNILQGVDLHFHTWGGMEEGRTFLGRKVCNSSKF